MFTMKLQFEGREEDRRKSYDFVYNSITYDLCRFEEASEFQYSSYDSYSNQSIIFVIAFASITIESINRVKELATDLLTIRMMHLGLEPHNHHYHNIFVYTTKSDRIRTTTIEKIINHYKHITTRVVEILPLTKKIEFLDLDLTKEVITHYCFANPTKLLWSLFFPSQLFYRELISNLPKDPSVWVHHDNLNPYTSIFLNLVVRGNRDYLCGAKLIDGKRVENSVRHPIFALASDSIKILIYIMNFKNKIY